MLNLARDVLDKQLLDREGRPFGKVDGIVVEVRDGAPPRVTALETGAAVQLARLPAPLRRWARPLARGARTTPIPILAVAGVGKDVMVDIDATLTPAWRIERWLAERVFAHVPGGR